MRFERSANFCFSAALRENVAVVAAWAMPDAWA